MDAIDVTSAYSAHEQHFAAGYSDPVPSKIAAC